ncbi:MAG: protein kinase [Polyangiaceae bacterium]|nr:protein kinase [Polyangiaceae bacterium]
MDDLIGETLKGTFHIIERIGEGAMGTVYRAAHEASGTDVALKIMHASHMREPGMLARFRREATIMKRVHHPNAVRVIHYGVDKGLVFLAMDLVNGVSVADVLDQEKRLPPDDAAHIVSELCAALAEMHRHGLVHRDVKPQNIMLVGTSRKSVKLIDFGIAKSTGEKLDLETIDPATMDDSIGDDIELFDGDDDRNLTCAGGVVGSPGYMAPEQWAGRKVDPRTDVYACGVLLYELITGVLPFDDVHPFVVAQRQLRETPRAPHDIVHEVPSSLSAIILKAIRPEPQDRFASAQELRDALRAFLIERTISATLSLAATLPVEIFPRPGSRQKPAPPARPVPLAVQGQAAHYSYSLPSKTLPLPDTNAPDTVPFPSVPAPISEIPNTEPLPQPTHFTQSHPNAHLPIQAQTSLEKTLFLEQAPSLQAAAPVIQPSPAKSIGRNGRSSHPPAATVALTVPSKHSLRKPSTVFALAAAFLTLGFVIGIWLFLPMMGR